MGSEYTLAQLAELLGMQPRTIRSYIEQGLLRGPEVGGRGARYTDYHFQRLQAIRTLKDVRGLPLSEVRRRLLELSGMEIASLAKESEISRTENVLSALDYLQSLKSHDQRKPAMAPVPEAPTPINVLLARLDRLTEGVKPPRRARGEAWASIPITPDVEIRVRGTQSAEQLAQWERLADYVREILLGGTQEES